MRRMFASLALCALCTAAPALAERVYVPMLGATGADGQALTARLAFSGTPRGDQGAGVRNLAAGARFGAGEDVGLAIYDVPEGTDTRAYLRAGDADVAVLPVFRAHETYVAGAEPYLDWGGGEAARVLVGAANPNSQAASCRATLFADGYRVIAEIPFTVEAQSLAREDAAAWTREPVAAAQVTCDQSFFPLAVAAREGIGVVVAEGIGPNGTCKATLTLAKQADGSYTLATPTGGAPFHQATKADPKGIVCIKLPTGMTTLKVGVATYEWDFTFNGWSSRNKSGVHNLGYFFLDRYRSGTVGNVNVLGPNKHKLKVVQNVGLPPCGPNSGLCNTKGEAGWELQLGTTYHAKYVYNASATTATLTLSDATGVVKTLTFQVKPGNGQSLVYKVFGTGNLAAVAEFGNYVGQHPPEEPSIGAVYNNFTLKLVPKQ